MKSNEQDFLKWVDQNIKDLSHKVIALNGATGGIGSSIATYLSYLNNDLILLVRNLKEGNKLKNKLEEKYHNKIQVIYFDYLDKISLANSLNFFKNLAKLDLFFNISGIYHQKYELKHGVEKTYFVNFFSPAFFIKSLLEIHKETKAVITSSVTSSFNFKYKNELFKNKDSFLSALNKNKNKTHRYGVSKHLLFSYLDVLKKENDYNIVFAHPGVAVTNLFNKKNKAYNKLFYVLVPPIMRLIFMSSAKGSLPLLIAASQNIDYDKWVGPRGLFHMWGYPKIYSLNNKMFNEEENEKIYKLTNEFKDLWKH